MTTRRRMQIALVMMILALAVIACSPIAQAATGPALSGDNGISETSAVAQAQAGGVLGESEIEALYMAIDDEYKALATYEAVMEKFGEVRPFINIAQAERNHIAALENLLERYGLEVPESTWADRVPEFDSLTEACRAGVEAEIANAALYDELFSMVEKDDIIVVFTQLRDASLEKHLPAFQRCAR